MSANFSTFIPTFYSTVIKSYNAAFKSSFVTAKFAPHNATIIPTNIEADRPANITADQPAIVAAKLKTFYSAIIKSIYPAI